jgi:hypothetical protein
VRWCTLISTNVELFPSQLQTGFKTYPQAIGNAIDLRDIFAIIVEDIILPSSG